MYRPAGTSPPSWNWVRVTTGCPRSAGAPRRLRSAVTCSTKLPRGTSRLTTSVDRSQTSPTRLASIICTTCCAALASSASWRASCCCCSGVSCCWASAGCCCGCAAGSCAAAAPTHADSTMASAIVLNFILGTPGFLERGQCMPAAPRPCKRGRGRAALERSPLERDVVVVESLRRLLLRRLPGPLRLLLALRPAAAAFVAASTTAAAVTAAAEHLHLVGHDLGEELLHPVLAGELVVADLAFHVHLRALAQVFAGDLAELAEESHPVPLGVLLGVAVLVLAHAGGGQADLGDRHAALGVFGLRVVAEVADQDRLVDATGHEYFLQIGPARTRRQAGGFGTIPV